MSNKYKIIIGVAIIILLTGTVYAIVTVNGKAGDKLKESEQKQEKPEEKPPVDEIIPYKEQIFEGTCYSIIKENKLMCNFNFQIAVDNISLATITGKINLSSGLEIVDFSSPQANLKLNEDLTFTVTPTNNSQFYSNELMTLTIQVDDVEELNTAEVIIDNIIAKTTNEIYYSFPDIKFIRVDKDIETITNQFCEIKGVSSCKYVNTGFEITVNDEAIATEIYNKINSDYIEDQNEIPDLWRYDDVLKINTNLSEYQKAGYIITEYRGQTSSQLTINGKEYLNADLSRIKLVGGKYLAIEFSFAGHFGDFTIVDNYLNELARISSHNGGRWVESSDSIRYYYTGAGEHTDDSCFDLTDEQLKKVYSTDGYVEYNKDGTFTNKTTITHYYQDVCTK